MSMNDRFYSALVVCLVALAGCADVPGGALGVDGEYDEEGAASPAPTVDVVLTCTADVRAGSVSCAASMADRPAGGAGVLGAPGELIVGSQGVLVRLASENVCFEDECVGGAEGNGLFQADVTVQNLMGQALGSEDGETPHADGVRVFFVGDAVVTSGTGAVAFANADGTAAFTEAAQSYIQYGGEDGAGAPRGELGEDGLLVTEEVSSPRSWRWSVDEGVEGFSFQVGVSAAVADTDALDKVLTEPGLLAAGANHVCALAADGAAYCWGSDAAGRLGVGPTSGSIPAPEPVAGGHTFASLSAAGSHTCGLTPGGQAFCWGSNTQGQLGNGESGSEANQEVPVAVSGGHTFVQVATGTLMTCGLTAEGAAYCWGGNTFGQLGTGESGSGTSQDVPTPVAGGHVFTSLTASGSHACGLTAEGAAYCWGSNGSGRLGTGDTANRNAPEPVVGGHTFRAITAMSTHTCGVTTGGEAFCWGNGASGQLGSGTDSGSAVPVPVAGDHTFVRIAGSGSNHTCGVTVGGAAYCWGSPDDGRLGTDPESDPLVPNLVGGGHSFSSLAFGTRYSCGITSRGEAYCWGHNGYGQLGRGTIDTGSEVPVEVQAPEGVVWKTSLQP